MQGVVFSLERYHQWIWQKRVKIVIDHKALKDILVAGSANARLNNWSLQIMGWDHVAEYRRGIQIPLPDMLSRLSTPYRNPIDNSNPDDPQEITFAKLKGAIPEGTYTTEFFNCEYLIGPDDDTMQQPEYMFPQGRRRMIRALMAAALHITVKDAQEKTDILKAALHDGQGEDGSPVDCHQRVEEKALNKLGGYNTLLKMVLGDELMEELTTQYGQDWRTRLVCTRDTHKDGEDAPKDTGLHGLEWRIICQEQPRDIQEIVREIYPDAPTPCKTREFVASLQETNTETYGPTPTDPWRSNLTQRSLKPIAADKYCGGGGMMAGLINAGFDIGMTAETRPSQRRMIKKRYGFEPIKKIEDLKPEHYHGHFVGFSSAPCTAFSKAGNQRGWDNAGKANHIHESKRFVCP